MVNEAKLCSPICSTFEALVCNMWSGFVMERKWALSADQCRMQALQFSVHLIDLVSILGFARIQKAVVDQTSDRPPNSDHELFLVQVWL